MRQFVETPAYGRSPCAWLNKNVLYIIGIERHTCQYINTNILAIRKGQEYEIEIVDTSQTGTTIDEGNMGKRTRYSKGSEGRHREGSATG